MSTENVDYKKRIIDSGLIFSIKDISNQVFSQWIKDATVVYDLSQEFVDKVKNDSFEEIFLDNLLEAIESLVEDKSIEKQSVKGWAFGFLCGHIQGALNIFWVNKYILEPSKEYENLMRIKAIREWINFDSESLDKIHNIYKYLIEQRIQPDEKINISEKNIIQMNKYKDLDKLKINQFKDEMIESMSEELMIKHYKLLDKKKTNCCPKITPFFDINEIKQIIGSEHFA